MWKFQNFSITQILREIKFGDFGGPKNAILTHLEALNFDLYEFLYFLKAKNCKNQNSEPLKTAKTAIFTLAKIDFT